MPTTRNRANVEYKRRLNWNVSAKLSLIDAQRLERLAKLRKQPLGALLRTWIIERLGQESQVNLATAKAASE